MKFEVYETENGFQFRVKMSDGEVLAVSETFDKDFICFDKVRAIKNNAASAQIEFVKEENRDSN